MDKISLYNISSELTYGRGYVYSLQYHIVWCTKYRRKVLKNGVDADCKTLLMEMAEAYRFRILAMEVMPDHIHLLVDVTPQFTIPDMIKIMKGGIARKLFLLYIESQKEKEWGGRGRPPKDLARLQAYHRGMTDADHIKLQSGDPETS